MSFRTMALVVCGAAAVTACASGGGRGPGGDEPIRALMSADALMFVGFDADFDLITSAAEIEAGITREFTRADANTDDNLSPIEFQNWSAAVLGGSQLGPYRLDFDRNVDNTISRAEFVTEIQGRVRDYDEDGNGSLSRSEYVRLIGVTRPPRERPQIPGGGAVRTPGG